MRIIRTAQRQGRFSILNTSITNKLILANVLIFIIFYFFQKILGQDFLEANIALTPSLIFQGKSLWTFLTSMFMHGSFLHIFANMFSLFFVGNFVEKIVGKRRFFFFYIISGLIAGIFFVLFAYLGTFFLPLTWLFGEFNRGGVGASGAIFGLLGLLAMLIPYSKIYLILGPLIVIILQSFLPESFGWIFTLIIFAMIFSLFSFNPNLRKFAIPVEMPMWLTPIVAIIPLVIASKFIPNFPIANTAHFGGLLVGLAYGFYLRKKFPNKTRMLSRHFQ